MAQFRFSDLPVELRLHIWEAALYQETRKRLVIFCEWEGSVTPSKQLISPLLTVNHESRQVAKAFYTLTLDVHRKTLSYPQHSPDPLTGILRLSLDRDIFVVGTSPGRYRYDPLPFDTKILHNYYTKPLSDDDCNCVQRTLYVQYTSRHMRCGYPCACYPYFDYCRCDRTLEWPTPPSSPEPTYHFRRAVRYYLDITAAYSDPEFITVQKRRPEFVLDIFTKSIADRPFRHMRPTDSLRCKAWDRALLDVALHHEDIFDEHVSREDISYEHLPYHWSFEEIPDEHLTPFSETREDLPRVHAGLYMM